MRTSLAAVLASLACCPCVHADETPSLARHVSPLLYQLGCSAGVCHGSFGGKGGFRLALFAGNADLDHRNLRGGMGRRVDPLHPEQSLLLAKPTGAVEHLGGVKLQKSSWQYQLLLDWIQAGAPADAPEAKMVRSIRVEPTTVVLVAGQKAPPVKVVARFSDGSAEDVTKFSRFEAIDPAIAEVDATGAVTGRRTGTVSILAHYAGEVGFLTALVPGPTPKLAFPAEAPKDRVDTLLVERMKKLNLVPSPACDDHDFIRRVTLDVVGQLPTPEQIRAFVADPAPDKREKLVDRLLADPLHAALWAGRLCDMLGADDRFIGNAVYSFHDWARNKFEANLPWDQIAKGVLVASAADGRTPDQILAAQKADVEERKKMKEQGKAYKPPMPEGKQPWQHGYAERASLDLFYSNLINTQTLEGKGRVVNGKQIALRTAHAFLGVQLECAQCHKHPYDRWSQADFFSFSAVFAHVGIGADPRMKALKVNLSGVHPTEKPVEEFLDPETRQTLPPKIPGGPALVAKADGDVRADLWEWMRAKDNPFFASALVNRVWEHYLGRGFVTPVDAQAAANPPSHPEVLKELVDRFVADGFDLRKLERRVLLTLAYQRDWRTNESNAADERNFSRRILRRLTAEQALDAIAQSTGTPVKIQKRFAEARDGVKAVEIALSRVGGDDGYVLQIFGRPIRVQNCDCERSPAASLSQSMYLLNDEKLLAKIHDAKGRLATLLAKESDDAKLLDELHLWTLSRLPGDEERAQSLAYVRSVGNRSEAFQDLFWTLLNRLEFVVNR